MINQNRYILPVIAIFDSGTGGLSIYKKIKKYIPYAKYIYIFDNAEFPYGKKSKTFILNRIVKIITKIHEIHKIDLTILACNTASIIALSYLKNKLLNPIIGIIPEINTALNYTKNKVIGFLGTSITINHFSLFELELNNIKIIKLDAHELILLSEEKILKNHISYKLVQNCLISFLQNSPIPDTIILGCTHLSYLIPEIIKSFPTKIKLIDSRKKIKDQSCLLLSNILKNEPVVNNISGIAYCTKLIFSKKLRNVLKTYNFQILKTININYNHIN